MPAELDVDKEQVRMLVLSVGAREAARRCNLKEDTVLQWSKRYGWLLHLREETKLPQSMQKQNVIGVISPADTLERLIREGGNATKLAGMKYAQQVTEYAAEMARNEPETALAHAANVKAALQSASIAGSWQQAGSESAIPVAFFSIVHEQPEKIAQVVELEGDSQATT